jgi:hypothetical protein
MASMLVVAALAGTLVPRASATIPSVGSVRVLTPATASHTTFSEYSLEWLNTPAHSHAFMNEFYVDDAPVRQRRVVQTRRKSLQRRAGTLLRLLDPRQFF